MPRCACSRAVRRGRARQRLAPTWFGGLTPRERMALTGEATDLAW